MHQPTRLGFLLFKQGSFLFWVRIRTFWKRKNNMEILTLRLPKCTTKLVIKVVCHCCKSQLTDQWNRIDSPMKTRTWHRLKRLQKENNKGIWFNKLYWENWLFGRIIKVDGFSPFTKLPFNILYAIKRPATNWANVSRCLADKGSKSLLNKEVLHNRGRTSKGHGPTGQVKETIFKKQSGGQISIYKCIHYRTI